MSNPATGRTQRRSNEDYGSIFSANELSSFMSAAEEEGGGVWLIEYRITFNFFPNLMPHEIFLPENGNGGTRYRPETVRCDLSITLSISRRVSVLMAILSYSDYHSSEVCHPIDKSTGT